VLASFAILAGVIGVAGGAQAANNGRWKTFDIRFDVAGFNYETVEEQCDPAAPANCITLAKVPGFTTTGDFVGTGVEGAVGRVTNSDLAIGRGVGVFIGTVKGCGSGSFVYTQATRVNLTTGAGHTRYSIAPGTGTEQLEGITGTFELGVGKVRCLPR
jgi:hypothetical protein